MNDFGVSVGLGLGVGETVCDGRTTGVAVRMALGVGALVVGRLGSGGGVGIVVAPFCGETQEDDTRPSAMARPIGILART